MDSIRLSLICTVAFATITTVGNWSELTYLISNSGMRKRDRIKKFWTKKIVPNKSKISVRVIRMGGFYAISGPVGALAFNATDTQEGYVAISRVCLGDKFLGFCLSLSLHLKEH